MPSVLIISGCPGTGKTTLARGLAMGSARGLHLHSDLFYGFPAHPIDPTTPASRAQNTSIMKALGRTAGSFVEDAWDVVLDGIVGPWFLPVLVRELPGDVPVDYVVLQATVATAVARVAERDGAGSEDRVVHMHRAFADLGPFTGHGVDTTDRHPDAVLAEVLRRRARGAFGLDRAAAAGS